MILAPELIIHSITDSLESGYFHTITFVPFRDYKKRYPQEIFNNDVVDVRKYD